MQINSPKNLEIVIALVFACATAFGHTPPASTDDPAIKTEAYTSLTDSLARSIFANLQTNNLDYPVFYKAYIGYLKYRNNGLIENTNVITIIDFDKASNQKRFFVVDIESCQILHNSYVAHGQNTGELMAEKFSNKESSHQSSLGFYLTDKTYYGKHGLSMRIDGLEMGINDKARERNIVVHSADYVSESFISQNNRLGRSWGCPALPKEGYKEVIEHIKNKSLLFIYSSKR